MTKYLNFWKRSLEISLRVTESINMGRAVITEEGIGKLINLNDDFDYLGSKNVQNVLEDSKGIYTTTTNCDFLYV